MKTINKVVFALGLFLFLNNANILAQDVNWLEVANGKKNHFNANFALDYSSYYGISYGYNIGNSNFPLVVDAEFNRPFGEDFLDDWYLRTGLQALLWSEDYLQWSARASFITRRYESEVNKLVNLGAEVSTVFGYQRTRWGIAAEVSYDHSSATHIENYITKEYYPEIKDGWYNTSGGNFKFGMQLNANLNPATVFLHLGKAFGQDFKDNPTLPAYAKIGISKSF